MGSCSSALGRNGQILDLGRGELGLGSGAALVDLQHNSWAVDLQEGLLEGRCDWRGLPGYKGLFLVFGC